MLHKKVECPDFIKIRPGTHSDHLNQNPTGIPIEGNVKSSESLNPRFINGSGSFRFSGENSISRLPLYRKCNALFNADSHTRKIFRRQQVRFPGLARYTCNKATLPATESGVATILKETSE
jgi:hypothetical protein